MVRGVARVTYSSLEEPDSLLKLYVARLMPKEWRLSSLVREFCPLSFIMVTKSPAKPTPAGIQRLHSFARLWRNLVELYSVTKSGSCQSYASANNPNFCQIVAGFKFGAKQISDTRDVAENDGGGQLQRRVNNAGVPSERPTAPSGSSHGGRNW